jgi:hypothetical protein
MMLGFFERSKDLVALKNIFIKSKMLFLSSELGRIESDSRGRPVWQPMELNH